MKFSRLLMVVILSLVPITYSVAKGKIIEGVISSHDCGDNCYLTIIDMKGKEYGGLCQAKQCEKWNDTGMPDSYKGRRVKIKIGKGVADIGDGTVISADAIKTIKFINAPSNQSVLSGKYIGKSEGSENELQVQDLGNGTIKFNISIVGSFTDNIGGRCTGGMPIDDVDVTASLKNNTATYTDGCTLRITFKGRKAIVKEDGCFLYHGKNCNFNATYLKER